MASQKTEEDENNYFWRGWILPHISEEHGFCSAFDHLMVGGRFKSVAYAELMYAKPNKRRCEEMQHTPAMLLDSEALWERICVDFPNLEQDWDVYQLRSCPCTGIRFHLNSDKQLWEDDCLDILLFLKVECVPAAVVRVIDYLEELPGLRIVCGDFGPSLGAFIHCLLYTSPSPRDISGSRMPSSA